MSLFLVQFSSVVSFLVLGNSSQSDSGSGSYEETPDYFVPDLNPLIGYVDKKTLKTFINEWRVMRYHNRPDSEVRAWFDNLLSTYGPHIVGYERCQNKYNFLHADQNMHVFSGSLKNCMQDCEK